MAAYFLFDNVEVSDPAALAEYAKEAAKLVAEHGESPAYQPLKAIRHRAVKEQRRADRRLTTGHPWRAAHAHLWRGRGLDCVGPQMGGRELTLEDVLGDVQLPYPMRPERLYTRDDLMQGWQPGADHSATLDARIYEYVKAHGGRVPDMVEGLVQRTHDHFIESALAEFLADSARPVIGIMGGSHTLASDPNYRRVVELATSLTRRGYLVVGGGGLGIMEAANLGAYLADRSDGERDDAVQALADTGGYVADQAGYLQVAVAIRERFAPGGESLAIPTWANEGEPISQFASHIAKYFSNSIREDGLLAVAAAGIVFAPGGAGTMQEIFQDAAQNAYQAYGRSPMVFLDRQHYCADTGLYPALQRQAERLGFADLLSIADEPAEILEQFPARTARGVPMRSSR